MLSFRLYSIIKYLQKVYVWVFKNQNLCDKLLIWPKYRPCHSMEVPHSLNRICIDKQYVESNQPVNVVVTVTVYLRSPVDFGVSTMIIYDTAGVNLPSPAQLKVPKLWAYFLDGMKCSLQVGAYSWSLSFTLLTGCLGRNQHVSVQVLWIYIAGLLSNPVGQITKLWRLRKCIHLPHCVESSLLISTPVNLIGTFKFDVCFTNVDKMTSHNKWWYNSKKIIII